MALQTPTRAAFTGRASKLSQALAQFRARRQQQQPRQFSRPAPVAAPPAAPDPALSARLAKLEAENEQLRQRNLRNDAVTFAAAEIEAGRAFPVERDELVCEFVQRAEDDRRDPRPVTFSDGKTKGTRVDQLKTRQSKRPKITLTQEMLPAKELACLFNQSADASNPTGAMTPERKKALLKHSPLGLAALKRQNSNGNGHK